MAISTKDKILNRMNELQDRDTSGVLEGLDAWRDIWEWIGQAAERLGLDPETAKDVDTPLT